MKIMVEEKMVLNFTSNYEEKKKERKVYVWPSLTPLRGMKIGPKRIYCSKVMK